MRCFRILVAAGLVAATTAGGPAVAAKAASARIQLTVLHTNDHQGRFAPSRADEYGLAARKTVIDRVRAEVAAAGGHVLLLDAGNVVTGVPESDVLDAEPDFKGMSRIGYDAQAVGSHELDQPLAVLQKQRQWAAYPMLAANVYRHGRRLFDAYRIFERGGLRIAVVGLTGTARSRWAERPVAPGIRIRSPIAQAQAVVSELRYVDLTIALTHLGSADAGGGGAPVVRERDLARAVPGLMLIVGGGAGGPTCMRPDGTRDPAWQPEQGCKPDRHGETWIVQAHDRGQSVGRADFIVENGQARLTQYRLLPVNIKRPGTGGMLETAGPKLPPDESLRDLLESNRPAVFHGLDVVVGSSDGIVDGGRSYASAPQVPLAALLSRAMRERTGADVAVVDGSALCYALPGGEIRYRDVVEALPSADTLVLVRLSGAELLNWLGSAHRAALPRCGGWPEGDRLEYQFTDDRVVAATVAGQAVEPARSYSLALTRDTASGRGGYADLRAHPTYEDTGLGDLAVLREYIRQHSPLHPADYQRRAPTASGGPAAPPCVKRGRYVTYPVSISFRTTVGTARGAAGPGRDGARPDRDKPSPRASGLR